MPESARLAVARNFVGEYCASLDIVGSSLNLERLDDEIERLPVALAAMSIRVS